VLTCVLALLGSACTRRDAPPTAASPRTRAAPATGAVDGSRALPSPLPRVAATVDGQPILIEHVALAAREFQARVADRSRPDPGAVRQGLQKLLVRELLFREALARGVQADVRTVENAYDTERARYPNATEWQKHLAAQGLDNERFRAELRIQATVQALQAAVAKEVDPQAFSEAELRAYFDQHPDVVDTPQAARPDFKALIPELRGMLAEERRLQRLDALVRRLEARARIEVFI
jgi:hypothetical protein